MNQALPVAYFLEWCCSIVRFGCMLPLAVVPSLGRMLLPLALVAVTSTCKQRESPMGPSPRPSVVATAAVSGADPASATCPEVVSSVEVAKGLVVERHRAPLPPPVDSGDRCIRLVRIDPARYRFRLLTALPDGGSLPAPEWAARFGMTGIINASMFMEDQKSTGLLVRDAVVHTGVDNPRFGGFMAFDPVKPSLPPVAFYGRDCANFDLAKVRKQYRSLVQNYRLLDCDGKAIPWRDEKVYSAAAIGFDREGRVVFLHTRSPYTMTQFGSMIAAPELGLRAALYVEGGPEASVYVKDGDFTLAVTGSYETAFREDDKNQRFWDLPNVLGFAPR